MSFLPRLVLAVSLIAPAGSSALAQSLYTDDERAKIVAYWNEPGRYTVSAPPEAAKKGPWQVRLTAEGSLWLFDYQKAVGAAKTPPTVDAAPASDDKASWEKWVQAKVDYDRYLAQRAADLANAAVLGPASRPAAAPEAPSRPGPSPASLVSAVGNPPLFAAAVTPLQYTIAFSDEPETPYTYQDHVPMRPRYAYYRFPKGTVAYGKPLREMAEEEMKGLFHAAGFNETEQRVMGAVSKLEGGFDAVNTYDTGYVSVGFIQFITHKDGNRSLLEVLQREKSDDPEAYLADFRRFGVDVNQQGVLVVVDPETGVELAGPTAVLKVIEDKRFAAVFQRAGRRSKSFQLAQIRLAKSHYWPASDPVKVLLDGKVLEGRVSDVIKTEAGLATIFDRKVNRGNIEPIREVVGRVMKQRGLSSLHEAAQFEREIVQELTYRMDFLKDSSLSQPK